MARRWRRCEHTDYHTCSPAVDDAVCSLDAANNEDGQVVFDAGSRVVSRLVTPVLVHARHISCRTKQARI